MRLLIVSPSASRAGGGVSEAVRQLGHLLRSFSDIDVRIFALEDRAGLDHEDGWDRIDVTRFPIVGPASYSFSPKLLLAILRERPDVVHVHGIWRFHCLPVLLIHLLRRTPYVVTPHGMMEKWIRSRSKTLKALVSGLYQNRFLRRAYAFHILTEKERGDVAGMVDDARCVLIPNFVAPAEGVPSMPTWWRPEFAGRDVFLFLGRIHEKKGCVELCDAWEAINAADPDLRDTSSLVFCGAIDGIAGFESRLDALCERFGNVIYAGPQYGVDKDRSLAAASFLCLPSKSEGLPLTVLEAWTAGLPVIMTPECNLAIGFARNAAIATTFEAAGIAESLLRASSLTHEQRQQMSHNATDLVNSDFSADVVGSAMAKLYRETIAIDDR